MANPLLLPILNWARKLRYPTLFKITAALFVVTLFLPDPDGGAALVNYRVLGRRLIVDRLFDVAELRLVSGRRTQTVRIEKRSAGR